MLFILLRKQTEFPEHTTFFSFSPSPPPPVSSVIGMKQAVSGNTAVTGGCYLKSKTVKAEGFGFPN